MLADDRALYTEGIALYNATVTDYLKWGKGLTADNRTLGETSETMRCVIFGIFKMRRFRIISTQH